MFRSWLASRQQLRIDHCLQLAEIVFDRRKDQEVQNNKKREELVRVRWRGAALRECLVERA